MGRIRRSGPGGDDMIDRYLERFEAELAEQGVRGPSAARVLDEARDHLLELRAEHGEQNALERFGASDDLARRIAAQLATTRTIGATYGSFAALALTGVAYVGFVALAGRHGSPDLFAARHELVGILSSIGLALFPQIAFVSGCLALLRALRLRGDATLPAGELSVIRRRASIALVAAGLTAVSMAVWSLEYRAETALLGLAAASMITLGAGGISVVHSGRPRAAFGGPPGDVFDDLGFRMEPWRFAALFAALIGLLGFAGGWIAEGGPGSGIVRGGFEALAVLTCFALLGRRLALRK